YQVACVLVAAAELDVFGTLGSERLAAGPLAARLGADARGTTVLLDALTAMGLLAKRGTEYEVPQTVAEALTEGGSGSVLAMVRHQASCLRRWAQLAEVVKSGRPAERVPSIRGEAADRAAFIGAMDEVSAPIAAELVEQLQPLEFGHLLDVGGASGTWTIALLRAVPGARATLFDLPDAIRLARQRIADAGLTARVTFAPGDFYTDVLPAGADFALCSAIAHQNSREQ
ncbi:unnamed protein product, partial [marine sediment metagenome]